MSFGFFTKDEINPPCGGVCKLLRSCKSPKMLPTGKGKRGILVVAEAPGEQEDLQGVQLIGKAGALLRSHLSRLGVDLNRDCRKTNACRCRPPGNRRPMPEEIAACASHVWKEIETFRPKVIILLGDVALRSFLLGRRTPQSISQFRGFPIPDQKAGCWVVATFHPSFILRMEHGNAIRGKGLGGQPSAEELIFHQDLKLAVQHLDVPFRKVDPPRDRDLLLLPKLTNPYELKELFPLPKTEAAIDYETTGLRPYRKGHRIVCAAWSDGKRAVAIGAEGELFRCLWMKSVLQDRSVDKVAHNLKFEELWGRSFFGVRTRPWVWDTMLAAHVLDNRGTISSLKKAAAYIWLGVENWELEGGFGSVDAEDTRGQEYNRLKDVKIPDQKLLRYNALDAFYTKKLADVQRGLFLK